MADRGGNGAKAFGGVMAILAILATVVASLAYFVLPLHGRLKSVEEQRLLDVPKMTTIVLNAAKIKELVKDHDAHIAAGGHPTLSERVKAIEANGVGNQHRDRIMRMLWFKVYGQEMPAVDGGH